MPVLLVVNAGGFIPLFAKSILFPVDPFRNICPPPLAVLFALVDVIDPLVVVMFPFVVDIFPEDVIVPLVVILPVDDIPHC